MKYHNNTLQTNPQHRKEESQKASTCTFYYFCQKETLRWCRWFQKTWWILFPLTIWRLCIVVSAKPFLIFIDDTMFWYLNSKLDLNLSCTKDFRNLSSMVTWWKNWRILLALIFFQRSLLKIISHFKKIGYNCTFGGQSNCDWQLCFPFKLHASESDFRLYDGSILKTYL